MIVCAAPAVLLSNVAAFPVPGPGDADQLADADHELLLAPFHVALAAWAVWVPESAQSVMTMN